MQIRGFFVVKGLLIKERRHLKCRETGEEKTIVFGLTGTGYFDMMSYEKYHDGKMSDYIPSDEELKISLDKLPDIKERF